MSLQRVSDNVPAIGKDLVTSLYCGDVYCVSRSVALVTFIAILWVYSASLESFEKLLVGIFIARLSLGQR